MHHAGMGCTSSGRDSRRELRRKRSSPKHEGFFLINFGQMNENITKKATIQFLLIYVGHPNETIAKKGQCNFSLSTMLDIKSTIF